MSCYKCGKLTDNTPFQLPNITVCDSCIDYLRQWIHLHSGKDEPEPPVEYVPWNDIFMIWVKYA